MNSEVNKYTQIFAWIAGSIIVICVSAWLLVDYWQPWIGGPHIKDKSTNLYMVSIELSNYAREYYEQYHTYPASMRTLEIFIKKKSNYSMRNLYYKKSNNTGYGIAYADLSVFLPQLQQIANPDPGRLPVGFPNCKGTPLYQVAANQQAFFITACDQYGALFKNPPGAGYYKDKESRSPIIVDVENKDVYNVDILIETNPNLFENLERRWPNR